jgi:polyferredoxin
MSRPLRQRFRAGISTFFLILFPVFFYYLSPVVPLYGSSEGIITGSLVVFFLLFLFSMILGRIFCSWVCPAGKLQDLTAEARTKRVRRKYIHWIKYLIWIPWLGLLFFLFRRAGGFRGVDFTYMTEQGFSIAGLHALIIYTIVVLTFFGLSAAVGRRAGCHAICWISPFMILGNTIGRVLTIPSLKLKTDPDSCVSCGRCDAVCPMSLNVSDLVKDGKISHSDCILCGNCVETCGKKTISFIWRGE